MPGKGVTRAPLTQQLVQDVSKKHDYVYSYTSVITPSTSKALEIVFPSCYWTEMHPHTNTGCSITDDQ